MIQTNADGERSSPQGTGDEQEFDTYRLHQRDSWQAVLPRP
jgi:hypothetical protein